VRDVLAGVTGTAFVKLLSDDPDPMRLGVSNCSLALAAPGVTLALLVVRKSAIENGFTQLFSLLHRLFHLLCRQLCVEDRRWRFCSQYIFILTDLSLDWALACTMIAQVAARTFVCPLSWVWATNLFVCPEAAIHYRICSFVVCFSRFAHFVLFQV